MPRRWSRLSTGSSAMSSPPAAQRDTIETDVEDCSQRYWTEFVEQEVKDAPTQRPVEVREPKMGLGKRQLSCTQRLLELCPENSDWPANDPLTQNMLRELDPATKEKYKCKNRDEQEAFKRKWAEEKLETLTERRQHLEEYQKIDVSLGAYTSASKCFFEEGGAPAD
eukprot:1965700-Lingulodinium_polyedra.AAC.1